MNKIKTAKTLKKIAKIILFTWSILLFVFALFSGSEQLGGGISGVIQNSPNALPWLLLFLLSILACKKRLIGGSIIIILGLIMIFFFKFYEDLISFFTISFPIIVSGCFLVLSYIMERKNNK